MTGQWECQWFASRGPLLLPLCAHFVKIVLPLLLPDFALVSIHWCPIARHNWDKAIAWQVGPLGHKSARGQSTMTALSKVNANDRGEQWESEQAYTEKREREERRERERERESGKENTQSENCLYWILIHLLPFSRVRVLFFVLQQQLHAKSY